MPIASNPPSWDTIEVKLDRILCSLGDGLSYKQWIEIYSDIQLYCVGTTDEFVKHDDVPIRTEKGSILYVRIRNYLSGHLRRVLQGASYIDSLSVLVFYATEWKRYTVSAKYINHVCAYLNRNFDPGSQPVADVYTLTLQTWSGVILAGEFESKFSDALTERINAQRDGVDIETTLIKNISESLVSLCLGPAGSLDVYVRCLQSPLVEATRIYYQTEAKLFLAENNVTDYVKKVQQRLAEESNRVEKYLHPSTHQTLIATCEDVLIAEHRTIIQEEFVAMLSLHNLQHLARTYNILRRVPGALDEPRREFETFVRKQGLVAIAAIASDNESDPAPYIETITQVYERYNTMVKDAFEGDLGCKASLDRACREYVNRNIVCKTGSRKSAELLAKYVDGIIKKATDTGSDRVIERVISVFKYLEDKDVFQTFHHRLLARRLVNTSSDDNETEAGLIASLREACGVEYVSRLQRMLQDVRLSKELNDMYREHSDPDAPDFEIIVGGSAQWPLSPPKSTFNVPDDLMTTYERFQRFYTNVHAGRKLNWLFHLGRADVVAHCIKPVGKTPYVLMASVYQASVLLQFNTLPKHTFSELCASTGLSEAALKGALYGLMKAKVLNVSNTDNPWTLSNTWEVNRGFKSKKLRVKVDVPMRSETVASSEATQRVIAQDRELMIQAAIVRVMKARNILKNQLLITATIELLSARFKPTIPDIKKCIDILLEKEYIERQEGDRDTYQYVA